MKHLIMGTAGHVDHGKTSLIKALTQIDCDTHLVEKKRGITINLGFSYLPLSNGDVVGIIDVPGHKDFINTMVSGACGIDFVLLVISADSGIMPQTIEHINILSLLGIKKAIVALNKIDLVDSDLSEMAKNEIAEFLESTPFKNSPIIGVSSTTGMGIENLVKEIENLCSGINEREKGRFFRMYIDRIFSIKGMGSVVTGSVLNGETEVGNELQLFPGNLTGLKIRSLEKHSKRVEKVMAGDRAAINLPGLKKEDVKPGAILTDRKLEPTLMFDASVLLFENKSGISNWLTVIFLSGTYESQARIHLINKNNSLPLFAQIHLEKSAILIPSDKFILRNTSSDKTIGGGFVIDSHPLHHKKITDTLIQNLSILTKSIDGSNNPENLIQIELKKEPRPFSTEEISNIVHLDISELEKISSISEKNFLFYKNNSILIHSQYESMIQNKILEILSTHHTANSLYPEGLNVKEIFGKTGLTNNVTNENYLLLLLQKMEISGLLKQVSQTWTKKDHQPLLDETTKTQALWLEKEIQNYGLQKPALSEIEEKAMAQNISKSKIKTLLTYLVREKKIYSFQSEVIHVSIVNKYWNELFSELKNHSEGIGSEDFRKNTGLSKRLCPILISIYEKEKIITLKNIGYKNLIFLAK